MESGPDFVAAVRASPALFPLDRSPDGRSVRLARLSEADYRDASFLDGRLLLTPRETLWRDRATLSEAARMLPLAAHFIFHLGHVGSTLIARLLGGHRRLFSLKEPALLREIAPVLADGGGWSAAEILLRLWSRTWRPEQIALIKATSLVSEAAETLLDRMPRARALVMTLTPPAFLNAALSGEAARRDVAAMATRRLSRLGRRLGANATAASEGEIIAASWLCETMALADAARRHGERMLWIDFDKFLAAPAPALDSALRHLGVAAEACEVDALARGRELDRYSKAPEHAFDATTRRIILEEARREHHSQIAAGMDWLQRVADAHPQTRTAMRFSAEVWRRGWLAGVPTDA